MDNKTQHGGKRSGAGRKLSYGEPTKQIRIPESQVTAVLNHLSRLYHPTPQDGQKTNGIYPIMFETPPVLIPLMSHRIPAGFPNPADDYIEDRIDLNKHLILHREATFVLRVSGWSMINAGIHDGDEIIVDRALTPRHGNVIVAVVNNDLTIKRLHYTEQGIRLVPENPDFPDIIIKPDEELQIWGVVTRVLHKV
jgi:DNA polymerase V